MNRLDRALGILLLLRSGKSFSAAELSRRFEVSARTIYRDVDTLCMLGAPIYAEMGRNGGFRLVEGYFLPPVMFSEGEAVSLLLGLGLLRRLHARPFAAELEISEQKLLAAVPDHLRAVLAKLIAIGTTQNSKLRTQNLVIGLEVEAKRVARRAGYALGGIDALLGLLER